MRLEAEPCLYADTLDHPQEARGGEEGASLRCEHEGRLGLLLALYPQHRARLNSRPYESLRRYTTTSLQALGEGSTSDPLVTPYPRAPLVNFGDGADLDSPT